MLKGEESDYEVAVWNVKRAMDAVPFCDKHKHPHMLLLKTHIAVIHTHTHTHTHTHKLLQGLTFTAVTHGDVQGSDGSVS